MSTILAFSRTGVTGSWLEPRCSRGRVVKAQATPTSSPTPFGTVRRPERQTAPTGGQCKPACPDVSVVESQSPRSKRSESAPSTSVSQRSRGFPISMENLPTEICVQLTRRLLSTASSLAIGEVRPRAVLRTILVIIWLRMAVRPMTNGGKPCFLER
jgi:hypothetical protein